MKKIAFISLLLLSRLYLIAQDIEVKKFEPLEKDQTAVTSPRKDNSGMTCALVKVALKEAGAEFEGNAMGDVQFTGCEYLVYMPNWSRRLLIKHPDYLPIKIDFDDYGTQRLKGGETYLLQLLTHTKKLKGMPENLCVRSFVVSKKDLSAYVPNKRLDKDGSPCALIKVRVVGENVKFDGNVIGNVEGRLNEYKVFVSPKSEDLKVIYPNCDPIIVSFEDYGIYSLSGGATYILTLITK